MAEKVRDVVCDMMVDPDTAPAKATYNGQTYYFCAPGCKVAFERDPEKYLGQGGASEKEGVEGHQHRHHH